MNKGLVFIKAHKIIFIIIGTILVVGIAVCVILLVKHDSEPIRDTKTSQTASESPKTTTNSEPAAETVDESQNTPETVIETTQSTTTTTQTPAQTNTPVQQQPTQPVEPTPAQKCADATASFASQYANDINQMKQRLGNMSQADFVTVFSQGQYVYDYLFNNYRFAIKDVCGDPSVTDFYNFMY